MQSHEAGYVTMITCSIFRTEIGESDYLVPGGDGRHHGEAAVLAAGDQCENSVSHDVLKFQIPSQGMVIKVNVADCGLRICALSCQFGSMPFCYDFVRRAIALPQVFHIMSLDGVCIWI